MTTASPENPKVTTASKEDLHKAMQGNDTLDGWDVLVSYSADKLNTFLQKAWNNKPAVNSFSIPVKNTSPLHRYTTMFDFKTANPVLSFDDISGSGIAVLSVPIVDGDFYDPAGEKDQAGNIIKQPIAKNKFRIEGRVPLAAINKHGAKFETEAAIKFDVGDKDAKYHVVFHFQNIGATWTVKGNTAADESGEDWGALTSTSDGLKSFFAKLHQQDHFDLSIAEVVNKTHDRSSDLMTPKSFAIRSQPGVLNVFIQTVGSGRGPGSDAGLFKLPNNDYTPVPTGYGASVIISRNLIRDFLVTHVTDKIGKPHLKDTDPVKEKKGESGIDIEVRFKDNILVPMPKSETISLLGEVIYIYYDQNVIDFDTHPITLSITDDPLTLQAMYSWKWDATGELFYTVKTVSELGRLIPTKTPYRFQINSSKRKFAWLGDDSIRYLVDFKKEDMPKSDGLKVLGHEIHINTVLKEYSIPSPELDYFRSTNIFAPGSHVIDAKTYMFPGDMVVLGDIATS